MLASRTGVEPRLVGVAAVKEKRITVIQRNSAAWIALYRTLRTHGNAYWSFNGPAKCHAMPAVAFRYRATDFKNVGSTIT